MSRDGRGNPGRSPTRGHQPRLTLVDLLRRRKTTLKLFIDELGITTFGALEAYCNRIGVVPPEIEQFDVIQPPSARVNSPQEGVIVLEAPPVVDEVTGQKIDPDLPVIVPGVEVITSASVPRNALVKLDEEPSQEATDASQKKARRKKENQTSDA